MFSFFQYDSRQEKERAGYFCRKNWNQTDDLSINFDFSVLFFLFWVP